MDWIEAVTWIQEKKNKNSFIPSFVAGQAM